MLRAKDETGNVATSALLSLAQPLYDATHHALTFQVLICCSFQRSKGPWFLRRDFASLLRWPMLAKSDGIMESQPTALRELMLPYRQTASMLIFTCSLTAAQNYARVPGQIR